MIMKSQIEQFKQFLGDGTSFGRKSFGRLPLVVDQMSVGQMFFDEKTRRKTGF